MRFLAEAKNEVERVLCFPKVGWGFLFCITFAIVVDKDNDFFSPDNHFAEKSSAPNGQSFEFQEARNYSLMSLREKVPSEVVMVSV